MSVFVRAQLVAQLAEFGDPQPSNLFDGGTRREIERNLERLVAEGIAVRTERLSYCSECGFWGCGREVLYALAPKHGGNR